MKRLLTPLLTFAILCGLFVGCANNGRIIGTGLEIGLTSIQRDADGSFSATWAVKNTNIVSYLFSRVSHKIQVNGTPIATVTESEALPAPPGTSSGRTSKLTGLTAAATQALNDALASGTASYRIETQLTILIYDDTFEKSNLSGSGSVPVVAK